MNGLAGDARYRALGSRVGSLKKGVSFMQLQRISVLSHCCLKLGVFLPFIRPSDRPPLPVIKFQSVHSHYYAPKFPGSNLNGESSHRVLSVMAATIVFSQRRMTAHKLMGHGGYSHSWDLCSGRTRRLRLITTRGA